MHTVELLPDPVLTDGVREMWFLLREAGLKSLAGHAHPSNRPHLTVVNADSLDGLPPLALPVAAELGEVTFLGAALVRQVTATAELAGLHAGVWSSLRQANAWPPPPRWRPHVSLALRVPPAQRASALGMFADLPPVRGTFVAARSYDTETRTVTDLRIAAP
nr:2'-5' RNA ligase family protein [uncultured Actinoplanes sp.]